MLYLTFIISRPFLSPIITAALLAVAIQPLFTYLVQFVRNRSAAACADLVDKVGMKVERASVIVDTVYTRIV
jgi:hypothetical protein